MCGHLSLFNLAHLSERERKLVQLKISPRGPDDYRHKMGDGFEFFHSRLAIQESIDHDIQPYIVEKRYILVYNGEIYNYIELRDYLKGKGVVFTADGDTEVLAKGLCHEGEKFLLKLNGMYSFVFYDSYEKSVLAARDRMGIKPLYYTLFGGGLGLSTNSWPLYKISNSTVDEERIKEILTFRYELSAGGVYKNVYSLTPGHYFKWKHGQAVEEISYWDYLKQDQCDYTQSSFEDILSQSIELRVRSKVPMTSLLSGGVDSSYLTLKTHELKKLEKAYTLNLKDNLSDVKSAEKLCHHLGLAHQMIEVGENGWLNEWDEALSCLESPVLDTIIGPTNLLFKKISKDYKVVFSGEGADEILAGYVHHALLRKIKTITSTTGINKKHFAKLLPFIWALAKRMSPYPGRFGEVEKKKLRSFLLEGDPQKSYEILISLSEAFGGHWAKDFSEIKNGSLEEYLTYDLRHWLPNYTLRRLDAISSSYGVEARVPYLDHRLVELMMSRKFKGIVGKMGDKGPLRDAHYKNYKEHNLWKNKKTPFVLSSSDYLDSHTKRNMLDRLTEDQKHSPALQEFCIKEDVLTILRGKDATSPLQEKIVCAAYLMGRWLEVQSSQFR